jgi:hypothetical protein
MSRQSRWSRRDILRGAGVSIALPLLPSLLPREARAQDGKPPVRLVYWYVADGVHMPAWRPSRTGTGYDLPSSLEPLAPIQDKVTVLSGLANMSGRYNLPGDHARGTGCFLTCERPVFTDDASHYNGVSVDQVAAQARGDETLFPSLQLGLEGGSSAGNCDSGYGCAYVRSISWADATTPLPKIVDPRTAFDRMFSGLDGSDPIEAARRRTLRLSVLDAVTDDAARMQRKMGATDRAKLDQYLTGVRELEKRVEDLDEQDVCTPPDRPEQGLTTPAKAAAMGAIMATALQCDLTRVISYMFANGGSGRSHTWLGISDNHHGLSHHQNDPSKQEKLAVINRWEVEVFVSFLQQLDAFEEADGSTLLDNSLVMFGSEISDGNRHNHDDLPVLLAGAGGGAVTPGRHLTFTGQEPIANLYLSMLDAFGAPQTSFGSDSTGKLAGLA